MFQLRDEFGGLHDMGAVKPVRCGGEGAPDLFCLQMDDVIVSRPYPQAIREEVVCGMLAKMLQGETFIDLQEVIREAQASSNPPLPERGQSTPFPETDRGDLH